MITFQNLKTQSKYLNITDELMYLVAFIYPLTTIPQIITIFSNYSSENISLVRWSLYAVCALITLNIRTCT